MKTKKVFLLVAIVLVFIFAVINVTITRNPLREGEILPPEFTTLLVNEGLINVRLHGVYRKGDREVRFFTVRGHTLLPHEASEIAPFEMSTCFIDESGHNLYALSGGDEIAIPECNMHTGEESDSDGLPSASWESMVLAQQAMQAIGELKFQKKFEPEQRVLTASLGHEPGGEALNSASGDVTEYTGGQIVIDADHPAR